MEKGRDMEQKIFLIEDNFHMFQIGENSKTCYKRIYSNGFPQIIIKVFRRIPFLVYFILSDEWKKKLDDYGVVVFFDSDVTFAVLKWMKKHYKNKRIILYYRNNIKSVEKRIQPRALRKLNIELWSYNVKNCFEYNMSYNPQVLPRQFFEKAPDNEIVYDIVFLGYAKKRGRDIELLQRKFQMANLVTFFYVPDMPQLIDNKCTTNGKLEYSEYIQIISKSKAILDLVSETNYGLTLRPIEAIFAEKKIITNYANIVDYDLYDKSNIFILNENLLLNNLIDFLSTPYKKINEETINFYDINSWQNRF